MEFQIIWFILWGVLWAVYFMLDGFDFGIGILHNFIGKTDGEKRQIINTVGPVWDGNEVWLITAGGATFAAFPTTYALMFSYLYTPLLIILFALIFRGVAFEFRGKVEGQGWKNGWDIAIFLGSFIPALLFGVAFGNIFQGLPMDDKGYHGSLFTLLNPYGILTGLLFVLLFLMHGSLWLSIRTKGEVRVRATALSGKFWTLTLVIAVVFLIYTYFATKLYDNYFNMPALFVLPLTAVISLVAIKPLTAKENFTGAFYASCVLIFSVVFTGVAGLFPNLIPSSISPEYSLTIFNTSSSVYTLKIMTVVALIFVPIVIAYQIWIYRVFREPISVDDVVTDKQAY
ncbi:MAG: cytochrome d ubiquinol oxidase subunit II [Thermodesulfovibrionales bacterium]|nr:cytochrome d ubiquinol oxidase subunit II [Thermodesulfovibrionales bacterium]